ncbi:hypothetical protein [Streptomyces sp. NPDC056937]|uniref:hypothetical protein n=1 Tax=Streptomyces sp. NPDC056937 TaxID=3345969 RepID=UPI00363E1071
MTLLTLPERNTPVISRARGLAVVGIAALTAAAGLSTLAFATPAPTKTTAVSAENSAAEDAPPFAIEDFEYPDAARILREKGITLRKGDGRIVFADCDPSVPQIQIWTRQSIDGIYCFRATAKTGYLTLEVPDVFALQTSDRPISADLTTQGKTQTVNVPKDKLQGVGEGTNGAPTVLVELRVTG